MHNMTCGISGLDIKQHEVVALVYPKGIFRLTDLARAAYGYFKSDFVERDIFRLITEMIEDPEIDTSHITSDEKIVEFLEGKSNRRLYLIFGEYNGCGWLEGKPELGKNEDFFLVRQDVLQAVDATYKATAKRLETEYSIDPSGSGYAAIIEMMIALNREIPAGMRQRVFMDKISYELLEAISAFNAIEAQKGLKEWSDDYE